ncbi:2-(3-amino-3-carboxypropyl)histidine synthase subunit [Candidatus Woesearchaeota archaeon]|nr:2-(3-amino-3-carboxypropyl)histidine synthase subunit [Candidatus Woesearchaeota archaeon]
MFIEAKSTADVKKAVEKAIKLLPKKVGIVTTAQHKHKLKEVKEILEKNQIKAEIGGQILGCDASSARKIKDKVDAFLYVGSGRFHPIEVHLETDKKVIMANPLTNEAKLLEKDEIEKIKRQQKGALLKFLSSKEIGVIVSTKPGQNKLKKALEFKKRLKDKSCHIFLTDTINPAEFENFPFIECWVNTACPRFADGKKGVINYDLVEKIYK